MDPDINMAEKNSSFNASDPEKVAGTYDGDVFTEVPMAQRGSVHSIMMNAQLNDARYNTTKRGLKSRHAQMIALGGTIGTG